MNDCKKNCLSGCILKAFCDDANSDRNTHSPNLDFRGNKYGPVVQ